MEEALPRRSPEHRWRDASVTVAGSRAQPSGTAMVGWDGGERGVGLDQAAI